MNVQEVPRTLLKHSLSAARLPVSVAAKVAGQADNEQWPPVLAFEAFEASVQTLAGSVLRDDELVDAGRLERARLAKLRQAADLETLAEATREQANEDLDERREQAGRKRQRANERAHEREKQAKRVAQQRKAKAKRVAREKTADARRAKADRQEAIESRERAVRRQSLAKESRALEAEREALSADQAVEDLGDTIERSKAARRTA